MSCTNCGARIARGDGRFCSHCGAALPDATRLTSDEWRTHEDRFVQARKGTGYEAGMAYEPKVPSEIAGLVMLGVMGVFGLCFFPMFIGGAPAMFQVFGVAFACVWFGALAMMARKVLQYRRAPLLRTLAVAVGERTRVSGGGKDHSATTHYYVTLQLENRSRHELGCRGELAGRIATGDLGIAFTKGDRLVDFWRLS